MTTPTKTAPPQDFNRQPHDDQAERVVLGAMMLNAAAADEVIETINNSADFYKPTHSGIYAAITAALAAGEPSDPTVIATYLARAGELGKLPGGAAYLHTLITEVPLTANAGWYARRVADQAARRRVIETGIRIAQRAADPNVEVEDLLDDAQRDIHLATTGRESSVVRFGDIVDDAIEAILSGQKPKGCVSTGLADLDSVLGGHHAGQLTIVGARPGMGKTVLALDFIRAAAASAHQANIPSLIFSLEMSQEEIVGRVLAAECGVNLTNITNRSLTETERSRFEVRRERLRHIPIFIDDSSNLTIASLRATARRAVQKHHVGLIAVDYLQLMGAGRRSESRQQDVAEISRGLKLMARELQVPVIACSQLNRGSESRTDRRPQLSDLRETGAIEQDADVVLLLHREDYYDKESPRAGEIDVIIAKNRFGPQDTVSAVAQLDFARIVNIGMAPK